MTTSGNLSISAWLKPGRDWDEGIGFPPSLMFTSGVGLGMKANLRMDRAVKVVSFEILTACCMAKMEIVRDNVTVRKVSEPDRGRCMACLGPAHAMRAFLRLSGADLAEATATLEANLASQASAMDALLRTLTAQAFLDSFIAFLDEPSWSWPREPRLRVLSPVGSQSG